MKHELSEQAVKELVEQNYKGTKVEAVSIEDDVVMLKVMWKRGGTAPNVALRILRKYPEIRVVHFVGGFVETVYTRNTLRFAGYDNI